jgi:hypothetical protein
MKNLFLFLFLLSCVVSYAQEKLPVIKLTGDFGYDYQDGTVSIIYPDGSSQDSLTARIKWRGSSTNVEGKHKRNYKIKFSDDYRFFGLRNDDSWILDAGQADVFRLRNLIATELWNDFATKPYYSDKEPEALSGVRGRVVEVYLNDEYRGIYSFTENMDRKQMKLKKFDKNGLIRGVLWKSKGYGSSLMNIVPETYNNKEPMMDVFEAKYPDLEDLDSTDYHTLWNAINFVVNSSDIDFKSHIHEYFDIPVIIDYYLFVVLLNALDNEGKNMFWAVYDQTKNKMITPAVWDLDISMGARSAEQYNKDFISPEYDTGDVLYLITRLKQLDVNHFNEKVRQRYAELRKTVFSVDSLQKRYVYYYDLLKATGAAEREAEKWSKDSDINGDVIYFDSEIAYIKNWIIRRIQYLDQNLFDYQNAILDIHVEHKNKEVSIYNLQGQKMPHNQKLPKGIYIYKNQSSTTIKYVGGSW